MISIRKLRESDVEAVSAVEAASPEGAHWGAEVYQALLADPLKGAVLVAELDGVLAGFICVRSAAAEAEVMNLAVDPARRRQHVGSRLLEEGLRLAAECGAHRVFLEVRQKNAAAGQLYRRFGFTPLGARAGYYQDPPDDALVLGRSLPLEEPREGPAAR